MTDKTEKATKAVILVRVSTREQEEGYSIDAQKYRLVEYYQRKSLEVIESSSRGDRKQFKEMIKFAKGHRENIAIVADKVDQWTYLGAWDPKNPKKKIYVREDEV